MVTCNGQWIHIIFTSPTLILVVTHDRTFQFKMKHAKIGFCDNLIATYVCANPKLHSKMKHVRIDFCIVSDHVVTISLHVLHISSKNQLVNLLTKPLPTHQLYSLPSKICVLQQTQMLRGDVK